MAHLSPSAIFSPSVARQQLAAAKDWNYIDSWLSSKFSGKTPPPYERNNETLKALLALAALNESADEEADLLARVEEKALHKLEEREEEDADGELLRGLEEALTREGKSSLDALAGLSVVLNEPIPDAEKMGRGILELQITANALEQTSDRIAALETHLNSELESINALLNELQSEAYLPPADIAKHTVDYQRKIKVLASKLPEMKDRASSALASAGPKVTIQDIRAEEDKFKALMVVVKDLEARAKTFHALPQDTDLARLELETVRADLRDLTRQRDSMFEGLVERASPRKHRS